MLDNSIIPSSRMTPRDNKRLFSISIVITLIFSIIVHVLVFQRYTPILATENPLQNIQAPIQFHLSYKTMVQKPTLQPPFFSTPLPDNTSMTSIEKIIPIAPFVEPLVKPQAKTHVKPIKTIKNIPAVNQKVIKKTEQKTSHQPKNKQSAQTKKIKQKIVKLAKAKVSKTLVQKKPHKINWDSAIISQTNIPTTNQTINELPETSTANTSLYSQPTNQYKKSILKLIENNKYYPKLARRRGIQGKVKVSFKLLNNGGIKDLIIEHKKSILVKATRKAIDNSLPLPTRRRELSKPLVFSFYMAYSLK